MTETLARHRTALFVIAAAACLDVILGALFAVADKVPVPDGLYFAVVTATTVGYGDITPRGWVAHLVAVLIMVTVIPLFGATFSLFSAGIVAVWVHRHASRAAEHAEAARKIAADLHKAVTGTEHPLAPPPPAV